MPGTINPPNPVGTLPFSISTKFSESRTLDSNANMYADGSCQRAPLALHGRRRWSISKRLTVQNLETLRTFWLANRANAFYFYNPHETDPPFSHAPSGDSGRYIVRFNSGWEETVSIPRSDAGLELVELASAQDIEDASDTSGNNPFVITPVSYSLSVTTAWTADFDGASAGIISPYGISFAFGNLALQGSGSTYGKRTDTFLLNAQVGSGQLPLETEFGVRGLSIYFFSNTYPSTATNAGQQNAEFKVYDVSLTLTYQDGTTRVFTPTTASLLDNGTALLSNAQNAVDGDPNTYADLVAPAISGVLWTLASPSALVVTNFV